MTPTPSGGGVHDQLPSVFEVFVGTSRGTSYGVWLEAGRIVYESFGSDYKGWRQHAVHPSKAQWCRFWRTMEEIDVWSWDDRYEPGERFEPDTVVREGVHWSLTLVHGDRAVSSSGDGSGPGAVDLDESSTFEAFLAAVARLLGGRPFV